MNFYRDFPNIKMWDEGTTPFLRLKMKFVMKFAESGSLWHSRPRAIKLKTSLFSQNEISFENVVRRTFVTS